MLVIPILLFVVPMVVVIPLQMGSGVFAIKDFKGIGVNKI